MRQTKTIGTLAAAVLPFIGHLFVPVAISAESKSLWVDAPSEALKASEPNIVYVDGQPLPVSLDNHHSFSIWIPVRNTGSSTGRAEFCILLQSERKQDCARDVNIVGPKNELVGGQVTTLSIRMSGVEAPISGYLGLLTYDLAGKPVAVSFRQLKVNAPLFPIIDWYPIGIGVAGSLLLCLYSAHRLKKARFSLVGRMGSPTWDFSKSWASNITVAGGLLSTALALTALPEQTHYMNKGGYAILNLLFTVLVVIAPFVFNVVRKPILDDTVDNGPQLQYQGYVISFLAASGITICAVTAQMIILIILIDEFSVAKSTSTLLVRAWQVVIGSLAVGVILYAAQTIFWTVKSQIAERSNALDKISAARAVPSAKLQDVHTRLSNWTPL